MQTNTPDHERPMLRMGSVAFLAGLVIIIISTLFHASSDDLMDNPVVFAVYAQSVQWIAAHIGQFTSVMLVFAGGFVALHQLLVKSESGIASAMAWFGLVAAVLVASTFTILQGVDGIALKIAVDTWHAIPHTSSADAEDGEGEKAITFRVAEGLRWTEIGINSYNRILQGVVQIIFGVAITKSALLSRWIGGVGIFAGAATVIAGVGVAYVGFAPLPIVGDVSTFISFAWVAILGIFMWRKTRVKKIISR
ncbi:MAG: hypothetical protein M3251_02590 [Thermoproteota archaeon]|nr:hypothetical protein [Thermoproteota archaeon]